MTTWLSFPAGAQRRGRESMARRLIVDPLPSLRSSGMTPPHGQDHPRRHHRPCAGDPDPNGAAPHRIGMAGTRPAMTGWVPGDGFLSKSSTLGPAACAASLSGDRGWRVGQPGSLVSENGRAELLVPHGTFRRLDLDQHRAAKGLPSQVCETCGRTVPHPTTATPRERAPRQAGMGNDIAKVHPPVKNKVRT
ncbi:hypothetical protein MicloDRAFT_00024940 [Microvirga lotononidis]|uniref:Uncharacterized protein n=1 Tax=Microvirga lotononidis TaxID=864069 RepID=I4YY07_9HYPH|nr:hypothetical protein MicloDRAFT_00024940 [Microvirga lotononidis]